VQYYLADSAAAPNSSEVELIGLYKLIMPLVDFLTSATRQSKARMSFDRETVGKVGRYFDAMCSLAGDEEECKLVVHILE
jgi:hypothetical protein